jgi:hypothetical protein
VPAAFNKQKIKAVAYPRSFFGGEDVYDENFFGGGCYARNFFGEV